MTRILTITMMIFLFWLQSFFFGVSDILSLILVILTLVLMVRVIASLHDGNRKLFSMGAKTNSFLYAFFTKEKTIFSLAISAIASLFLAVSLIVTIKGLVLSHGQIAFLFIVGVISFALYPFPHLSQRPEMEDVKSSAESEEKALPEIVIDNLASPIVNHAANIVSILMAALALNLVLSLMLSAHDIMSFYTSEVTFDNFTSEAASKRVEKTIDNEYSRVLINIYILVEHFRLALANLFVESFIDAKAKDNFFYAFYFTALILNMIKLFAFCLSLVLLQRALTGISQDIVKLNYGIFSRLCQYPLSLWNYMTSRIGNK